MEYAGTDGGVRFSCFLPSLSTVSPGGGSSLIVFRSCSLPLCPEYNIFRTALKQSPPTDENVRAALQVLRRNRHEEDEVKRGKGDEDENDNDVEMADEVGQPSPSVDFEILVRNATEEFGFAPHDVYDGVFQLPYTKDQHAKAVEHLEYTELGSLVNAFPQEHRFTSISDRVVAVSHEAAIPGRTSDRFDWRRESSP